MNKEEFEIKYMDAQRKFPDYYIANLKYECGWITFDTYEIIGDRAFLYWGDSIIAVIPLTKIRSLEFRHIKGEWMENGNKGNSR